MAFEDGRHIAYLHRPAALVDVVDDEWRRVSDSTCHSCAYAATRFRLLLPAALL